MAEMRVESRAVLDLPAQVALAVVAEYGKSVSGRYRVYRGAINWAAHRDEVQADKCTVAVMMEPSAAGTVMAPKGVDNEQGLRIEVYTKCKSEPGPNGLDDEMLSTMRYDLWVVMQRVSNYLRQRVEGRARDDEKLITKWDAVIDEKYDEAESVMGIEASVVVSF